MGSYSFADNTHVFEFGEETLQLSEEQVADLLFAYTRDGLSLTRHETAMRQGLTVQQLLGVFRLLPGGPVTKGSPRWTPQVLLENEADDLLSAEVSQRGQILAERRQKAAPKILRRELDRALDYRDVITGLTDALRTAPFSVVPLECAPPAGPASAQTVYCFQDWHVGAVASPRQRWQDFNATIFEDRIKQLMAAIGSWQGYAAPEDTECVLFFNGDLLDDFVGQMHYDQMRNQDLRGIEQLRVCARACVSLIQAARVKYPRVKVIALPGNHDRAGKKREDDPARLGHLIVWEIVRGLLPEDAGVEVLTPAAHSAVVAECAGVRVLGWHGDQAARPDKIVGFDAVGAPGYRILVKGHVHKRQLLEDSGYMFCSMPSLMGASNYSEDFLFAYRPGQGVIDIAPATRGGGFQTNIRFIDLV